MPSGARQDKTWDQASQSKGADTLAVDFRSGRGHTRAIGQGSRTTPCCQSRGVRGGLAGPAQTALARTPRQPPARGSAWYARAIVLRTRPLSHKATNEATERVAATSTQEKSPFLPFVLWSPRLAALLSCNGRPTGRFTSLRRGIDHALLRHAYDDISGPGNEQRFPRDDRDIAFWGDGVASKTAHQSEGTGRGLKPTKYNSMTDTCQY